MHALEVSHGAKVRVLDVPLDRLEILDDLQHLLDVFAVFLSCGVKLFSGLEFTARPDVGGLELRVYLTLRGRPDDVEMLGGILFVIEFEDVANVGGLELGENVEFIHSLRFCDRGGSRGPFRAIDD